MPNQRNHRQLRVALYRLKRQWGITIKLFKPLTNTVAYDTGVIGRTYQIINIRSAILAPQKHLRQFQYDLSYIAANKNFTYGADYGHKSRMVIVDGQDLPRGFIPTPDMHLEFQASKWEIKSVDRHEIGSAWTLMVEAIDGVQQIGGQ